MRNRCFATLGLLTLLATTSAFGQLQADIPFEFHVGATVMPAGQYYVGQPSDNHRQLLSFDCYECQAKMMVQTIPIIGSIDVHTTDRLVFRKYGDTYFLAEVWQSGQPRASGPSGFVFHRQSCRAPAVPSTGSLG